MPHILIIDDEAHILQVLSLKLRNAGYAVTTASDGEEGYELVRKSVASTQSGQRESTVGGEPCAQIDLIITDFQMPYMTGLELCKALAGDERTASIPVIMLTARGYALDDEDLTLGNIKDVLSKPFSPRAIVEQIQQILGTSTGVTRAPNSADGLDGNWQRSEVA
jgi:two-component system alkaline phosphatase synthesis response regulator PhoP